MKLPLITAALASVAIGLAGAPAMAAYPDRPVTFIVAWGAGGATDLVARSVQEAFAKSLGQQVIVKNVPGAAGTIGTTEAASAAPDGYTILVTPAGPLVAQPHRMKLKYDLPSFAPVCKIVEQPLVLMAVKSTPYKTVADIVKAAKAAPNKITYGTSGPGTLTHLAMLALDKAAGIKLKHVPFKGSADAVQAMLSSTVNLYSDQANLVPQYDLLPIAAYSDQRLPNFKDTPTMRESGYDISMGNYVSVFVPKGTPQAVIDKIGQACKAATEDPATKANLERQKYPIAFQDAKALGAYVAQDYTRVKALVEEAGLARK